MKSNTINAEKMGKSNKRVIFEILRKSKRITRKEIADVTGLNPSTVTNIISDFKKRGFIEETGTNVNASPGRRSINLKVVKESAAALIVVLGVENTEVALGFMDNSFEIVDSFKTETDKDRHFGKIEEKLKTLYETSKHKDKICSLVFSVPGIVDRKRKVINTVPHLGWSDIDLSEFSEKISPGSKMEVLIANEAKLALLAEIYENKNIRNMQNGVYIYISQGVGGAVLIDSKPYLGNSFIAGELGHMSINEKGTPCSCGRKGCLEKYIGADSVTQAYEMSGDELDGSSCREKFQSLVLRASAADGLADSILRNMMEHLATGVINVVNLFNPDFVVVGGMGEKIPDEYMDIMRNEVLSKLFTVTVEKTKIIKSVFDIKMASITGATLMSMESFGRKAIS